MFIEVNTVEWGIMVINTDHISNVTRTSFDNPRITMQDGESVVGKDLSFEAFSFAIRSGHQPHPPRKITMSETVKKTMGQK